MKTSRPVKTLKDFSLNDSAASILLIQHKINDGDHVLSRIFATSFSGVPTSLGDAKQLFTQCNDNALK